MTLEAVDGKSSSPEDHPGLLRLRLSLGCPRCLRKGSRWGPLELPSGRHHLKAFFACARCLGLVRKPLNQFLQPRHLPPVAIFMAHRRQWVWQPQGRVSSTTGFFWHLMHISRRKGSATSTCSKAPSESSLSVSTSFAGCGGLIRHAQAARGGQSTYGRSLHFNGTAICGLGAQISSETPLRIQETERASNLWTPFRRPDRRKVRYLLPASKRRCVASAQVGKEPRMAPSSLSFEAVGGAKAEAISVARNVVFVLLSYA
eukprot:scaffold672_cov268-Pinguiococcus_pyrenoidosus.AAC.10